MSPTSGEAGAPAVLLLGARSEIGVAVARRLVIASPGPVTLAARRPEDLDGPEAIMRASGAPAVTRLAFDADDTATHGPLLHDALAGYGAEVTAVVAFGILGDQARAERDAAHALAVLQTDLVAQVSVLTHLSNLMVAAGGGRIVVFSSIAGARVRRANYVYGAAKAGLDGFATGLATALAGSGVHVLLVRPGFVIGRMTEGMAPAPLATTPEAVAAATVDALTAGRSSVWVPRALGPIAALTHLVPVRVWARLPR